MNPRGALLQQWAIDTPLLKAAPAERQDVGAAEASLPIRRLDRKRVRLCEASNDWPASTDVWCWYCCHPFSGPPLPMPIKYDDRRGVFHVTGTFCSWACMKAYNSETGGYLKNVNAMHITLFHKKCTGRLGGVRPAPPRLALRVFGGKMTIEEFREASGHDRAYTLLPPKMIVHQAAIEETSGKRHPKPCNLAETVCFKDATAKNETLRLKRPKPLQHNRNTLERTMGINALMAAAG